MTFQNFVLMDQYHQTSQSSGAPAVRTESSFFHRGNYVFNIVITPLTPFQIKFMYNGATHSEHFIKTVENHLKEIIDQIIDQVITGEDIPVSDIGISAETELLAAQAPILEEEDEEWLL